MAVDPKRFAGSDKKFYTVYKVGGINTRDSREAIQEDQFSWLENMQPISDGNFQSLHSNDPPFYTTTPPRTIIYHYPFNIGQSNYIAVFLDDGTAVAVNTDTSAVTTISAMAGSFYPGTGSLGTPLPQCSQFGQSGLIIVSTALLGYSFWDGNLLYTVGTIGPNITITNAGSAYQSNPFVQFSGGSGTGTAATSTINNGSVSGITVTNPGSGYLLGDIVTVTLVGGQLTGSGASLTAVISLIGGGSSAVLTANFVAYTTGIVRLSSITVSNGGSGYSASTTATWNYTGATHGNWNHGGVPAITFTVVGGVIQTASFTPASTNNPPLWTRNSTGNPTITVSDPAGFYTVTSVTVTSGGTNYSSSTVITATGGGSPVYQAVINPVIASGVITGTTIQNGGNYGSNTPPTLTVTDAAALATAKAELMPFGIQGTCVETYQGRIWIGNGAVINFSSPGGDVADFNPADGAGAFTSNDSFLRREYTAIRQSAGFLYLFGDSSVNVVSNVQTGGSPVATTFNNQNVSPSIGTSWHNSVVAVEDSLVFANLEGVYRLSGGNVQKVSDDLDGVFEAAVFSEVSTQQPTSALMHINEKVVYMLVVPILGPFDTSPNFRTGVVMWDGRKWWIGSQLTTMTQVATQEINSSLQAWGNSGTTLNKMFVLRSQEISKIWQTKLWSGEGPYTTKQIMRLFTMGIDDTGTSFSITGSYDFVLENMDVQSHAVSVNVGNTFTWLSGSGSFDANVRGNYVGLTMQTTKRDFTLIGHWLLYQEQSPLGG